MGVWYTAATGCKSAPSTVIKGGNTAADALKDVRIYDNLVAGMLGQYVDSAVGVTPQNIVFHANTFVDTSGNNDSAGLYLDDRRF